MTDLEDNDDGLYEAKTEVNRLEEPSAEHCQWDKGCSAPATHNVCQYDPLTAETLVDGVDLLLCAPHARALASRINEWEP